MLVVLLDDVGFGAIQRLWWAVPDTELRAPGGGWPEIQPVPHHRAVRPHALALLTGRNHHSAGMGVITEMATSAPGYNSLRPNTVGPLAETLKLNGYSTAQFGKCHEVPAWQTSRDGAVQRLAERRRRL